MKSVDKTGHLAWCALVALMTARENGQVNTELQENMFILRWFTQARKQRRFSRDVANDIDWVISQGSRQGVNAGLRRKLEYLWSCCSGSIAEQTDMFRFTCAMEKVKSEGWEYYFLDDREWRGKSMVLPPKKMNVIYLAASSLDVGFDDDGWQLLPIPIRITGERDALDMLLNRFDWKSTGNNQQCFLVSTGTSRG